MCLQATYNLAAEEEEVGFRQVEDVDGEDLAQAEAQEPQHN